MGKKRGHSVFLSRDRCRVNTLFCSRAGRNASFGDAGPVVRKLLRRLLCPSLIHAPTVWRVILRVGGFVPFTDYRFCCSSIFLHMANSLVCSIRYSARPCRESGRALHNASFWDAGPVVLLPRPSRNNYSRSCCLARDLACGTVAQSCHQLLRPPFRLSISFFHSDNWLRSIQRLTFVRGDIVGFYKYLVLRIKHLHRTSFGRTDGSLRRSKAKLLHRAITRLKLISFLIE